MIGQNFVGARKAFFQQQVALKLCGIEKQDSPGRAKLGVMTATKVWSEYDFGRHKQRCNADWGNNGVNSGLASTQSVRLLSHS